MDRDLDRLHHVLEAARKAVALTAGMTRSDLDDDDVRALAIVHLVEIVGEASKGVSAELRSSHPDVPWNQMAATRDRLVHGYYSVDLDIVWQIVTSDLPPVVKAIERIIDALEA